MTTTTALHGERGGDARLSALFRAGRNVFLHGRDGNPVKHGHVACPKDWPWSSFHRFAKLGEYEPDWGCRHRPPPEFGDIDEALLD